MTKKKILVDATEITPGRIYASIPIYIQRYLNAIPIEDRKDYTLLINSGGENFFQNNFPGFQLLPFHFSGYREWFKSNPLFLYTCYKLKKQIEKKHFDVIFIPSDGPLYLQGKLSCKKVIVIHDLKRLKMNICTKKIALKRYYLHKLYGQLIQTSDEVIAISQYTKQDILTYYPATNESKIHVIYNSVTLPKESVCPQNFNDTGYILYVNAIHPYKNIMTLLKAFQRISDKVNSKLVVVGKPTEHWENKVLPYIKAHSLDNSVVNLHSLTNEELKYVYEHAALFVSTSLYEGFGYTPIEAALCKCPVICSIQEALPDSTQGLLNYYYPAINVDMLSEKMLNILNSPQDTINLDTISKTFSDLYSEERQRDMINHVLCQ